jgi:NAD(P)H dehydrogenase (quinone)
MILVTGATGQLGGAIVDSLLQRVAVDQIAVCVKSPDKARHFAALGVEVRTGDLSNPESLRRSFAGADRLLLVSASGIDHEKRVALHRNAIDAAVRAKVGHLYYTSLVHADDSLAYVMTPRKPCEPRNGIYAEAWPTYLGDVASDEVVIPADGPVAWVSRHDLAEATSRLLAEGDFPGETLTLTGPEAIDIGQFAKALGQVRQRPLVRLIRQGDQTAFAEIVQRHGPVVWLRPNAELT